MRRLATTFLALSLLVTIAAPASLAQGGPPSGGGGVQPMAGGGGGDTQAPFVWLVAPEGGGDVYTQYPYIEIEFCDNLTLNPASRVIRVNNVVKTSSFTYSATPSNPSECTGEAAAHTYSSSVALVMGSNQIRATICDNASNCTTQTWYVWRRAGPLPAVSLAPYNADIQDYARCAAACFTATYAYSTVPRLSLGRPLSVTLLYNGDRADPRPFVHVDVTHGGTSGNLPEYFYLKLQRVGGAPPTDILFLNGEYQLRFAASAGAALRLGGQFSAAVNGMTSDSVYRINVIVGAKYSGGVEETVLGTTVIVLHNHAARGVARGWGIAGIQRLIRIADSALVVEGDGSASYHRRSGATTFTAPAGDFSRLSRVVNGSDTTYVRAYPDSTKVTFTRLGLMVRVTNAFGLVDSVTYDGLDRVFLILDRLNNYSAVYYKATGYGLDRIVSGAYSYFTVNGDSTLRIILDPDNFTTTLNYDASRRLRQIINRRGDTVSTLGYHAYSGRVVADSGPSIPVYSGGTARPVATFDAWQHAGVPYASTSSPPYFSPPLSTAARATLTDAGGHVTRFTANAFGQPVVLSGGINDTVVTIYSPSGLPGQVTPNMGVTTSFSYDASGQPTNIIRGGLVRVLRYMPYGVVTMDSGDGGPVRRDTLILASRQFQSSVAGAPSTVVRLDQYGRDSAITDPSGHLIVRRWYQGPHGNLSRDSSAGGRVRIYGYDANNRPAWDSVPGEPRRNIRTYDALNRVIEVRDTSEAAPTFFGYDGMYLRSVTDPLGNRDSTYYNALGWPIVHVDHLGRRDSVLYDVEGLVRRTRSRDTSRVDTVSFVYDAGHRLRSRRGPYIVADTFAFTGDSIAVARNANSTVITYLGGPRRQLDSVVTWLRLNGTDSVKYRHVYIHHGTGRFRGMLDSSYAAGGGVNLRPRGLVYDSARFSVRGIRFAGGLTTFPANADGLAPTTTFPGGETLTSGLMASHNSSFDTSSVLRDEWAMDSRGRLIGNNRLYLSRGVQWSYDRLDHLAGSRYGALTCTESEEFGHSCAMTAADSVNYYLHDRLGNRIRSRAYRMTGNDSTLTYSDTLTYGPMNRLATGDGCTQTYDGNGNVTQRTCAPYNEVTRYYWNGDGQLSAFTRWGDSVAFAYDPLGRVVRRTVNGTVASNFLWEGDNLHAELAPEGLIIGEYSYYGMDQLHAFIPWTQDTTAYYAHRDQVGNVRGLSNGAGTSARYTLFGDFGAISATFSTFSGEAYDRAQWKGALQLAPEAGLYYMRNRWYDTRSGRFISEDPIGLAGGLNLYAFVNGDPVNGADPLGLTQCKIGDTTCVVPLKPMEFPSNPSDPWAERCSGAFHWSQFYQACMPSGAAGHTDWLDSAYSSGNERPARRTGVPNTVRLWNALRSCVEEHYGVEGLGQLGLAILGAPIVGKHRGGGAFGGASSNMSVASRLGQILGDPRLPRGSQFLNSRRLGSIAGRFSYLATVGFAAYDATTIGMCMYQATH